MEPQVMPTKDLQCIIKLGAIDVAGWDWTIFDFGDFKINHRILNRNHI